MSDTYLWRRRKQVQGPFDAVKMKEFYDNGSLNATHEISADGGNTWFPAGDLIATFTKQVASYGVRDDSGGGGGGESGDLKLAEDEWHFEHEGVAKGPITFSQLQQLFATGRLTAQTRVWKESMGKEWQSAANIPGLIAEQEFISDNEKETPKKQPPNPQIFAALGRSRPWATFLAVVLLISGGLGVIGGILIFIQGAKFEVPFVVGQGIGTIIGSGVTVTVAIILLSFSALANTAQIQKTDQTLIAALDGLRRYFLVLGMVVLLWLSMGIVALIITVALV